MVNRILCLNSVILSNVSRKLAETWTLRSFGHKERTDIWNILSVSFVLYFFYEFLMSSSEINKHEGYQIKRKQKTWRFGGQDRRMLY